MAVNKVIYSSKVIVNLTDATVTAEELVKDVTAYGASGEKITGKLILDEDEAWEEEY